MKYRTTNFISLKSSVLLMLIISVCFAGCTSNEKNNTVANKAELKEISQISFRVLGKLPHDTMSFTEGLLFHEGELFESTGSPDNVPLARSVFGTVDPQTGKINVKGELDRKIYFGEGIIFMNGKIFQLTYKNQICFVYDAKSYKKIKEYSFSNKEGWGFTTNGKELIMTDGTNVLTFLDPETFNPTKTLQVSENGFAVDYLNEMEYINGYIYANIWGSNTIVKINPDDGNVVGKMDLASVAEDARNINPRSFEMNGIAYDSVTDKIYVTGKMWANLYEISFAH
jgi:glutamine cyclotransferase